MSHIIDIVEEGVVLSVDSAAGGVGADPPVGPEEVGLGGADVSRGLELDGGAAGGSRVVGGGGRAVGGTRGLTGGCSGRVWRQVSRGTIRIVVTW